MNVQACKVNSFTRLIHNEAFPGFLLMIAATLAVVIANTPFSAPFQELLHTKLGMGSFRLSVAHWIQDGLMALFFLFVSLELKRELVAGVLANPRHAALPVVASLGGTVVPALVYYLLNKDGGNLDGWAISSATDIAFSLGVLSLFGNRVPNMLKVFLLALAIVDDMAAVLIIAFGYTTTIIQSQLGLAMAIFAVMLLLNRLHIRNLLLYWILGLGLWFALLPSGLHATIAGVLTAFAIPVGKGKDKDALLLEAEYALRPWVQIVIMPLYALAFAGFSFAAINLKLIEDPVTLGILFGLLVGKPLGVVGAALLFQMATKTKLHISLRKLWGVGCLAGIGFTMSLFIGGLAFGDGDMKDHVLMGVYAGSILSALIGAAILHLVLPRRGHTHAKSPASAFLTGE